MKQKRKQFPRLMALFLAALLTLGMFPSSAFAAETPPAEFTEVTVPTVEPPPSETLQDSTAPSEQAETEPTVPAETTPAETTVEPVVTEPAPEPVISKPEALDTTVQYYEDYFALLHAQQGNIRYHLLTRDASYHDPCIWACPTEIDPDMASVGFEINLHGVDFVQESNVNPAAEIMVELDGLLLDTAPEDICIFDVGGDTWIPLVLDTYSNNGTTVSLTFYAPEANSKFAIIERIADASPLEISYGTTLGASVKMGVNNKVSWCVMGKNPYGFGNSSNGTFAIHLVHKPTTDPSGKTVGREDYMAAGCLEYWKAAPAISEGQIVNVGYSGSIGGWSSLSASQRRQIVGYLLYGVRYLSDWSFADPGTPSIGSTNPVVNMSYAQQILIWSAVKGIDPYDALNCYMNDVPYYGEKIIQLANQNPENFDYDKTLVLVGEGGSKQDMALILKPVKKAPPSGDIVVDKSVTGSNKLGGWKMELYNSYKAAQAGTAPIATAVTNSAGRATFNKLLTGTYYVREANASKQSGNLTYWTLSDKILTVKVNGKDVHAGTITNTYNPDFSYSLHKVPACSDAVAQQLAGNSLYSLAGAKYRVSKDGVQQEILTTNADGNAQGTMKYPEGTRLSIQEISAPPGYRLDSNVYPLIITSGNNVLTVRDIPVFDPPFALTKIDRNATAPQGNMTFEGAVFKFDFFTNHDWSGTPERTWYFSTNAQGTADYHDSYLANGYQSDPLYFDNGGNPTLPLGSLRMTEVKNPLGYLVLPVPLYCRIIEDASAPAGGRTEFTDESLIYIKNMSAGNYGVYEAIDTDLFASIQLDKVDSATGSVPQGDADLTATFEVINNSVNPVSIDGFPSATAGQVCYEFNTDADGHFVSRKIFPVGKYTIREKKAPDGYSLNPDWLQNFEVTESALQFDFTAASGLACANDLILPGSFEMDKLDFDTGNVPQGDASLGNAGFELVNNSAHSIKWDGKLIPPGEVLTSFITDESGHYSRQGLPIGNYYIREVTPPEGYLVDLIWQYDFSITADAPHVVVAPELTCQDQPIKGGLRVIKQDFLLGDATTEDCPMDGISFSVFNESMNPVVIDGVAYAPGDVVTMIYLAWDGTQWSAQTETNLPYGTYSVVENQMTEGMANNYYKWNPEKHIVVVHDGQTAAEITHVNELVQGQIIIHKADPIGSPLAGAKFLLEWSADDGSTWHPVAHSGSPSSGSCTSPDLADGTLTTGEDGLIVFSGLYPTLLYRVTELEAPEGYVLLRDSAFEGKLPNYEYTYTLTVHNAPGFSFPSTGSTGFYGAIALGLTCMIAAFCFGCFALVTGKKRRPVKKPH